MGAGSMAFDRTHGHANGRPRHAVQDSSPRNVGRLDKAINRGPKVRFFFVRKEIYSIVHQCQLSLQYHLYSLQMSHTHHFLPSDDQDIDQGRSQGDFVASTAFYTFVAQATYTTKQASIRSMHTTYHSLFHPPQNIQGFSLYESSEKVRFRLCRDEYLYAAA
jgi:hypothetical protein